SYLLLFSMLPRPPTSTLFPYTMLFRSEAGEGDVGKWLIAHVWDLVCGASTCRVLRSDSRSAWVAAMRGDSPLCGDPNGQGIRSSCMTRSGACVGGARIADCLGNGMAPSGAVPGNSRTMAAWGRPGFFRTVALIRAANRPSLASIPAAASLARRPLPQEPFRERTRHPC